MTIGNSVKEIGLAAFSGCSSLTSVIIPDSVTEVGDYAFSSCYSLTSLKMGNSVTGIGMGTFQYCSSLTSVTIPSSVTIIQYRAFTGCNSLSSLTIPDSVKEVGMWAFAECNSLVTLYIPESVKEFGDFAFSYCQELTSVYYDCEEPIESINEQIFLYSLDKATLYVPEAAVEKSKLINPWKDFNNIVAHDFSEVKSVNKHMTKTVTGRYDTSGSPVDGNYKGLIIIRYSDGSTEKTFIK